MLVFPIGAANLIQFCESGWYNRIKFWLPLLFQVRHIVTNSVNCWHWASFINSSRIKWWNFFIHLCMNEGSFFCIEYFSLDFNELLCFCYLLAVETFNEIFFDIHLNMRINMQYWQKPIPLQINVSNKMYIIQLFIYLAIPTWAEQLKMIQGRWVGNQRKLNVSWSCLWNEERV